MSLLHTTIKPALPAGKYPVQIMDYSEVENEKGGYIALQIAFPDREMQQNFFPKNLEYLGKSLRTQLNKANETMELVQILEEAKGKPLFAVVSYNEYGMNLAFHEVTKTAKTTEEVAFEDDAIPPKK
jgi:hypothetical protein